jgi:thiol-disulfide isomerase/thioredoxin
VPSFALPDVNLKTHDVLDYRGKPLIIDLMMTSCPHCQALAPNLERVAKKYAGKVNILSIVVPPDTNATVAQYVAKYKVGYPILFDCGQATATLLKVTPQNPKISLPHLFLVDARGMIREDWAWSEAVKEIFEGTGLDSYLDKVLAGK